jgi:hypothetical protein
MTGPAFTGELLLVMGFHAVRDLYEGACLRVDGSAALRGTCHAAAMAAAPTRQNPRIGGWVHDYEGIDRAFGDGGVKGLEPGDRDAVLRWLAQAFDGSSRGANPKAIWIDAIAWCFRATPDLGLSHDETLAVMDFCTRVVVRQRDPRWADAVEAASEAPYELDDLQLVERHNYHLASEDEDVPMVNGVSLTLGVMRRWHIVLEEHRATEPDLRPLLRRAPEAWVRREASATRLRTDPASFDLGRLAMDHLVTA